MPTVATVATIDAELTEARKRLAANLDLIHRALIDTISTEYRIDVLLDRRKQAAHQ